MHDLSFQDRELKFCMGIDTGPEKVVGTILTMLGGRERWGGGWNDVRTSLTQVTSSSPDMK